MFYHYSCIDYVRVSVDDIDKNLGELSWLTYFHDVIFTTCDKKKHFIKCVFYALTYLFANKEIKIFSNTLKEYGLMYNHLIIISIS